MVLFWNSTLALPCIDNRELEAYVAANGQARKKKKNSLSLFSHFVLTWQSQSLIHL